MGEKDVSYGFALDENGVKVDARVAPKGKDALYRCIHCGVDMHCYRGKKNVAHFRHREPTTCDPQIYLRKLARQSIWEWYNTTPNFLLSYWNKKTGERAEFNLKTYYTKAVYSVEDLDDPGIPKADVYLIRREDDGYTSRKPLLIRIFLREPENQISDFKVVDYIVSGESRLMAMLEKGFQEEVEGLILRNIKNYDI